MELGFRLAKDHNKAPWFGVILDSQNNFFHPSFAKLTFDYFNAQQIVYGGILGLNNKYFSLQIYVYFDLGEKSSK